MCEDSVDRGGECGGCRRHKGRRWDSGGGGGEEEEEEEDEEDEEEDEEEEEGPEEEVAGGRSGERSEFVAA
nr:unnamed protein product [Spirometra erinaceieuropaei]